MQYFVWYDADTRRSIAERMQDALAAYTRRFQIQPNLVLVSADDLIDMAGVEVRSTRTVQPHTFWVGRSDDQHPVAGAEGSEQAHG